MVAARQNPAPAKVEKGVPPKLCLKLLQNPKSQSLVILSEAKNLAFSRG
jgi:hypothetical protein